MEVNSVQMNRSDFVPAVTRQLGPVLGIIITVIVDTHSMKYYIKCVDIKRMIPP
jgi:hypothetical protein